MKKFLFLAILISVASMGLNAQKIKKNEVDKFSNVEKIETSSETLYSRNPMLSGYTHRFDFTIKRYNGEYIIAADILMPEVVKYTDNDGIIFLLDNGSTIKLTTNYIGVGGDSFGNGYYFCTSFNLTKDDVSNMKHHKITDIRISYLGGHYDHQIKGKKQELIQKMLHLFDNL